MAFCPGAVAERTRPPAPKVGGGRLREGHEREPATSTLAMGQDAATLALMAEWIWLAI